MVHSLDKLSVLGKGSSGTVFLVCTIDDESMPDDLIAVKSAIHHSANSLIKERLVLEELKNCPEIICCLGSKESVEFVGFKRQKYLNLLLEYAPGGTLGDLIRKRRRLTETATSCYTRVILKGLRAVHAKGIVHCDLKPENILAFPGESDDGLMQLKIADFGRAKLDGEDDDEWSPDWEFRGTPSYMSPESVREGKIGPALDIWSVGCIVVEMFTGERAMKSGKDLEAFAEELGSLKRSPVIPEEMSECGKDFLKKCFASDPVKRWTAEMLLDHEFICRTGIGGSMPFFFFFLPF